MKYNDHGPPCNRLLTLTTAVGASRVEEGIPENQGADFPHSADSAESLVVFAQLVPLQGGEPITIDKDRHGGRAPGRTLRHRARSQKRFEDSLHHRPDRRAALRSRSRQHQRHQVNGQRIIRGALLPGDQLRLPARSFASIWAPAPPRLPSRRPTAPSRSMPSRPSRLNNSAKNRASQVGSSRWMSPTIWSNKKDGSGVGSVGGQRG